MKLRYFAAVLVAIVTIAGIYIAIGGGTERVPEVAELPDASEEIDDSIVQVTKIVFDSQDPSASTVTLTASTRVSVSIEADADCDDLRLVVPGQKESLRRSPEWRERPLPSFQVSFVRRASDSSGEKRLVTGGSKPRALDARHIRWDGHAAIPAIPGEWRVRIAFVLNSRPVKEPEYTYYTVAEFDVIIEEPPIPENS